MADDNNIYYLFPHTDRDVDDEFDDIMGSYENIIESLERQLMYKQGVSDGLEGFCIGLGLSSRRLQEGMDKGASIE